MNIFSSIVGHKINEERKLAAKSFKDVLQKPNVKTPPIRCLRFLSESEKK